MLHELSFGRADFVRASKGALKLGLERLVALEDLLYVVFLKRFRVSQVVSYSRFELGECVALKVAGDIYNLIRVVKEAS